MANSENTIQRRTPRWVKAVLVVSLALNFVFIGLGAGLVLRSQGGRGPAARDAALMLARALPRADRRELFREFRQRRGEIVDTTPGPARYRRQIAEILRTRPFDAEALRSILGEQRQRGLRIANAGSDAVVEHLAKMTDEERAAVARRLLRGPERRQQGATK